LSSTGDGWVQGVYPPESQYEARCQSPRSGTDPITGQPYPDVQGSTLDENLWLRSWTNDWYLWYSEVPDIDPGTYSDTASYFAVLKTSATDALGEPEDKFHFTVPTSQWEQLTENGQDIGYGLTWAYINSAQPPRQIYAAYVWPGYAAANAGVQRGYEVVSIDGVSINAIDQTSIDTLNQGLSPTSAGESHAFVFANVQTNATASVTLQAAQVTETPVALTEVIATPAGPVGYLLYNDLAVASSEQELIGAINTLQSAQVTDLVLDLRYNGGGFLAIASELAYMIAGPGPTASTYFDKESFNSKHPSTGPDGQAIVATPFYTTTQPGFSTQNGGTPLPYLGLSRVFVLTGTDTCSASEAIMNGLNGLGVQVIQIGSTTCGKPYGFYPPDNCGTTYFSIEFQGNNWVGFGDYPDGFTPQNSSVASQLDPKAVLPGCSVADDFLHALGDQNEGRLAGALAYATGGNASCPTPSGSAAPPTIHGSQRSMLHKPPWRTIRILGRPSH
jgi:carboxyl-terminal processing protease